MDAIETIIQKINQQAKSQREIEKNEKIAAIDQFFISQQEKIRKHQDTQFEQQKEYSEKKFRQESNRLKVQARQIRLSKRQSYLDQLFAETEELLSQWNADQHRDFLVAGLNRAGLNRGRVIAGGAMAANVYSESWLQMINEKEDFDLSLGGISSDKEIGFLLELKGIRYNFYYKALLQEIKKQSGARIMQELFKTD